MAIDLMCNSRGQERMWVLLSRIEISPDLGLKSTLRLYYKSVAAQTKCDGFGLARCNFCLIPTHNKIWRLVTQITRLSFKAYLIKNSHFPQQVMTSLILYDVTISLTEEFVNTEIDKSCCTRFNWRLYQQQQQQQNNESKSKAAYYYVSVWRQQASPPSVSMTTTMTMMSLCRALVLSGSCLVLSPESSF